MRSREAGLKGVLPSKACRTMPSRTSPRLMSWYSAKAFRTLRIRFSMRTPVCTRSTRSLESSTMVPVYHGTKILANRNRKLWSRPQSPGISDSRVQIPDGLAARLEGSYIKAECPAGLAPCPADGRSHVIVLVLDGQGGASSQPDVTHRFIPRRQPEGSDLFIFVMNFTLLRPERRILDRFGFEMSDGEIGSIHPHGASIHVFAP